MTTSHIDILAQALGATALLPNGNKNNLIVLPGTSEHAQCLSLVQFNLLKNSAKSLADPESEAFQVTHLGAQMVRQSFLNESLESLLADRISDAASIAASELVGPNSFEYEHLSESLQEEPDIVSEATSELLRKFYSLCAQLRTQLTDATNLAAAWMPDEFQNEEDRLSYVDSLARHEAALEQATNLMGNMAWLYPNDRVDEHEPVCDVVANLDAPGFS